MMEEERAKRYRDKLNFISERVGDIESWIPQTVEEFLLEKKTRLATYKAFQEAVETSLDIVAMICKDMKIVPKEDYVNIEELYKKGLINSELRDAFVHANGLRNILIHRYNVVDDRVAFESIGELLPNFPKIVKNVEKWLKKRL